MSDYLRNIVRSGTTGAGRVGKDLTPSAHGFGSGLKTGLEEIRQIVQKNKTGAETNGELKKNTKDVINNFKKAMKTGDFTDIGAKDVGGDFGFDSESSEALAALLGDDSDVDETVSDDDVFADSPVSQFSDDTDEETGIGSSGATINKNSVIAPTTNIVTNTMMSGPTKEMTEASTIATIETIDNQTNLSVTAMAHLTDIVKPMAENLFKVQKFNMDVMSNHIEATAEYQTAIAQGMATLTDDIGRMSTIIKDKFGPEKREMSPESDFEKVFGSGHFDFGGLMGVVKEKLDSSGGGMLQTAISDFLEDPLKGVMSAVIPGAIKESIQEMDKFLFDTVPKNFLSMINNSGIGSLLGLDLLSDGKSMTFDHNARINQKAKFDGVFYKSVVTTIPGLLSKILNVVDKQGVYGGEELIFDHSKGQFLTQNQASKNLQDSLIRETRKNIELEDEDIMREILKESMGLDGNEFRDAFKDTRNQISNIMLKAAKENSYVNFKTMKAEDFGMSEDDIGWQVFSQMNAPTGDSGRDHLKHLKRQFDFNAKTSEIRDDIDRRLRRLETDKKFVHLEGLNSYTMSDIHDSRLLMDEEAKKKFKAPSFKDIKNKTKKVADGILTEDLQRKMGRGYAESEEFIKETTPIIQKQVQEQMDDVKAFVTENTPEEAKDAYRKTHNFFNDKETRRLFYESIKDGTFFNKIFEKTKLTLKKLGDWTSKNIIGERNSDGRFEGGLLSGFSNIAMDVSTSVKHYLFGNDYMDEDGRVVIKDGLFHKMGDQLVLVGEDIRNYLIGPKGKPEEGYFQLLGDSFKRMFRPLGMRIKKIDEYTSERAPEWMKKISPANILKGSQNAGEGSIMDQAKQYMWLAQAKLSVGLFGARNADGSFLRDENGELVKHGLLGTLITKTTDLVEKSGEALFGTFDKDGNVIKNGLFTNLIKGTSKIASMILTPAKFGADFVKRFFYDNLGPHVIMPYIKEIAYQSKRLTMGLLKGIKKGLDMTIGNLFRFTGAGIKFVMKKFFGSKEGQKSIGQKIKDNLIDPVFDTIGLVLNKFKEGLIKINPLRLIRAGSDQLREIQKQRKESVIDDKLKNNVLYQQWMEHRKERMEERKKKRHKKILAERSYGEVALDDIKDESKKQTTALEQILAKIKGENDDRKEKVEAYINEDLDDVKNKDGKKNPNTADIINQDARKERREKEKKKKWDKFFGHSETTADATGWMKDKFAKFGNGLMTLLMAMGLGLRKFFPRLLGRLAKIPAAIGRMFKGLVGAVTLGLKGLTAGVKTIIRILSRGRFFGGGGGGPKGKGKGRGKGPKGKGRGKGPKGEGKGKFGKIGQAIGTGGKALWGGTKAVGKFMGPVGIGFAALDGYDGWTNAGELLGKDEEDVGFLDKSAGAVSKIATLGFGGEGAARFVRNPLKTMGGWFKSDSGEGGPEITSGFGQRTSPFSGKQVFHPGVDVALKEGTPLTPHSPGMVTKVGEAPDLGKFVEIKHMDGSTTRFGHLSKVIVEEGQQVQPGVPLGLTGNTGRSTSPHLHVDTQKDGKFQNPMIQMFRTMMGGMTALTPTLGLGRKLGNMVGQRREGVGGPELLNPTDEGQSKQAGSKKKAKPSKGGKINNPVAPPKKKEREEKKREKEEKKKEKEEAKKDGEDKEESGGLLSSIKDGIMNSPVGKMINGGKSLAGKIKSGFKKSLGINAKAREKMVNPSEASKGSGFKANLSKSLGTGMKHMFPAFAGISTAIGAVVDPIGNLLKSKSGTDEKYQSGIFEHFSEDVSPLKDIMMVGFNGVASAVSSGGGGGSSGASLAEGGPTASGELQGNDNAEKIWNFFKDKGVSDEAAAGIIGNLMQESRLDPTLHQSGGGPGRGLLQWEEGSDRFDGLVKYAKSKGVEWTDMQAQLEYMWWEMTHDDNNYNRHVMNKRFGMKPEDFVKMNDVQKATEVFERTYERAGKPMMEKRKQFAAEAYNMLAGKGGGSEGAEVGGLEEEDTVTLPDGSVVPKHAKSLEMKYKKAIKDGMFPSRLQSMGRSDNSIIQKKLNPNPSEVKRIKAALEKRRRNNLTPIRALPDGVKYDGSGREVNFNKNIGGKRSKAGDRPTDVPLVNGVEMHDGSKEIGGHNPLGESQVTGPGFGPIEFYRDKLGWRYTSGYGPRSIKASSYNFHYGHDYAIRNNEPIPTPVEGEVIHSYDGLKGWGKLVTLQDNKGFKHLFAHLNDTNVKKGDRIPAGHIVGLMGGTGQGSVNRYAPHLHYQINTPDMGPTEMKTKIDPAAFNYETTMPEDIGSFTGGGGGDGEGGMGAGGNIDLFGMEDQGPKTLNEFYEENVKYVGDPNNSSKDDEEGEDGEGAEVSKDNEAPDPTDETGGPGPETDVEVDFKGKVKKMLNEVQKDTFKELALNSPSGSGQSGGTDHKAVAILTKILNVLEDTRATNSEIAKNTKNIDKGIKRVESKQQAPVVAKSTNKNLFSGGGNNSASQAINLHRDYQESIQGGRHRSTDPSIVKVASGD